MIGAIIGDIVGSRFEFVEDVCRDKNFGLFVSGCRPTDDTFMTLAVAHALFIAKGDKDKLKEVVVRCMRDVAHDHPDTGWGGRFYKWLFEEKNPQPYNSYGNGAGMRISPVGWVADSEAEVKELSKIITEVSHNHPEGMKGAEAVATAVYLARTGKGKEEIRARMQEYYPQLKDEKFTIENIYGHYGYDYRGNWVTCQGSIPQALVAFLDSESFEDAIRKAVYIGGDSDTIGAMAGSIAEAYYGVPFEMEEKALSYLSSDLLGIYYAFDTIRKARVKK
ncbi:MAG: ADP-ribosylglycohydrolase family protein [Clostridiales bacterium]|nr:ADP-ribosylglycohydrolase family protein [Clostridiales bacterium]